MKKTLVLLAAGILAGLNCFSQHDEIWHGKKCAVVLTYDDGLNVHLNNAIAALDSFGLKGTFYIPGNAPTLKSRLDEWRLAAANGHELGNHTLFHPCNGNLPGRNWVSKDHDLANYTLNQIIEEINVCNTLLKAIDGKSERTFAFTCGDMEVEGKQFYERVSDQFLAARGVTSALNFMETASLRNINSYMVNGQNGDELIQLVDEAGKANAMVVFLFHGVGGEHSLDVSLSAHRQLLKYLNENKNWIWNTTMVEFAKHVIEEKEK